MLGAAVPAACSNLDSIGRGGSASTSPGAAAAAGPAGAGVHQLQLQRGAPNKGGADDAAPAPQLLVWQGSSTDMSAMTAVGLLNRPAHVAARLPFSAAYASFGWSNHHSREWLQEAVATDPKLRGVRITNTTNRTLVVRYALQSAATKGLVLFNSSEGNGLLPTVLTLCSVYDAVAVDMAKPGGREASALGPVLFDSRGRWADQLSAGAWAVEHLLPRTASDDLMVVTDPGVIASGYLVDIAIARKLFVMANKVCTPFSKASELFDRVAESAHWQRK